MSGIAQRQSTSQAFRIRVRGLARPVDAMTLEGLAGEESQSFGGTLAEPPKSKVITFLNDPACEVLAASKGDRASGLAIWRVLPWDSEQFGFPAARIEWLSASGSYPESRETQRALLRNVLRNARLQRVRHMVARVDAGSLATIHALEDARFETIDGIQTFARQLTSSPAECSPEVRTRLFRDADLAQVLAISRRAYVFDRFHADPSLEPEQADAINQEWVRNCCLGIAADAVIVACRGEQILGYVTCALDRTAGASPGQRSGAIGMVATAEEARGCGVATAATFAALRWFREQQVARVEVGTQLRNIPASRLYETCGFRLVRASLTLRRLL